ncbi:PspC domain-containing protein [uncultured Sphingomonas sp.]|uniref:PspC domain-containing protein n=1 Tax=uncultured Sphingomonas sp. TaxID=158754 RepID=UPI0035CBBC1F
MPQAATFNRSDTLLGVCEAIGQDLGINPLWIRLALTLGLFWNAAAIVGLYAALAVAVYAARRLTPVTAAQPSVAPAALAADNDAGAVEVKAAA